MIRASSGLSLHEDSARAAIDAADQVLAGLDGRNPDWCIAFATTDHRDGLRSLVETLQGRVGTPYVVGCSAAGVMVGEREVEAGPALGVLGVVSDEMRGTPFLFHDEGDHGLSAGIRLGQRMQSSHGSDDTLLVWPDPFHVRPDRLLQCLDAMLGEVPVIGGAASSATGEDSTFQFSGNDSGERAVAGIRLSGRFRRIVGVTQGCRPLGEPMRVTGAHENMILELDGVPALDALRERAPQGMLDDPDWAFNFLFVGLLPDPSVPEVAPGEYLVRNIVTADPDTGVLAIADHVEEGQHVLFVQRDPESAQTDLVRALERIDPKQTGLNYRFGLYFNCLSRGRSLYQEDGVDGGLIARTLPGVPMLGFFCNAEIGPLRGVNQLFTYTGMLLLVAD